MAYDTTALVRNRLAALHAFSDYQIIRFANANAHKHDVSAQHSAHNYNVHTLSQICRPITCVDKAVGHANANSDHFRTFFTTKRRFKNAPI
jgi:hypothetical protein